jgi:hypothetical protein
VGERCWSQRLSTDRLLRLEATDCSGKVSGGMKNGCSHDLPNAKSDELKIQ